MTALRDRPELEWRVVYARASWQRDRPGRRGDRTAARHFARHADALAFATKLRRGRPGLSPLRLLRLERRPVGAWRQARLPDDQAPRP